MLFFFFFAFVRENILAGETSRDQGSSDGFLCATLLADWPFTQHYNSLYGRIEQRVSGDIPPSD